MKKLFLACLLCIVLSGVSSGNLFSQEKLQERLSKKEAPKGLPVGTKVEDFKLKTYDGRVFKLTDYTNKKIVIFELGAIT